MTRGAGTNSQGTGPSFRRSKFRCRIPDPEPGSQKGTANSRPSVLDHGKVMPKTDPKPKTPGTAPPLMMQHMTMENARRRRTRRSCSRRRMTFSSSKANSRRSRVDRSTAPEERKALKHKTATRTSKTKGETGNSETCLAHKSRATRPTRYRRRNA